jgi:hypothetical protein
MAKNTPHRDCADAPLLYRRPAAAALAVLLLAGLLFTPAAPAQNDLIGRIQSGLDGVARGFDYVGRKAGDIIGPGLGFSADQETEYAETRRLSENYPAAASPLISISNEFGAIRVKAWDDRIVRIDTEIIAGADTADLAAELARAIDISIRASEDVIDVRTFLPDTRGGMGAVSMTVNYSITVPRDANVVTSNFFGDTAVSGINGGVAVENQYGQVELRDLGAHARVRVHGEFPFLAENLRNGGVFHLHGARAEFAAVGGATDITASRGELRLHGIPESASITLNGNSCPLEVRLDTAAAIDFSAALLFSQIESEIPLERSRQGNRVVLRHPEENAARSLTVNAAFGALRILRENAEAETASAGTGDTEPFNGVLTHEEKTADVNTIQVRAATGDIRIAAASGPNAIVTASRIVWVPAAADAPAALEAITLEVRRENDKIIIHTAIPEDMDRFGCLSSRIDLSIQCPPRLGIVIEAQSGLTAIEDTAGAVTVMQDAGDITAAGATGPLKLTARKGAVTASGCTGAVQAEARYGAITLTRIGGPVRAVCAQADTIIESPGADAHVRVQNGDVRLLALEPPAGGFDIAAENGNISMLLSPEADAAIQAKTKGGRLYSNIPMTGTINRDERDFEGRLKAGRFIIRLETINGDIILD